MTQRSRSPEEILHREMLKARAIALARKEIYLTKTPRFQKGRLIETMRSSVKDDYNKLIAAY